MVAKQYFGFHMETKETYNEVENKSAHIDIKCELFIQNLFNNKVIAFILKLQFWVILLQSQLHQES